MALAENYQLKWHSFSNYLYSCVAMALQNESFADVALVTVDGHQIMAHRFILSANSRYFHQILKMQPKVTTALPIMIVLPSEISHKTLRILIQYMYSGEATVSNDILENVLRGGDILKVKGLYRPKEEEQLKKAAAAKPTEEKATTKATPNEQKVLNYTLNVKNFNSKPKTDSSDTVAPPVIKKPKPVPVKEPATTSNKSCSSEEDSKSNETLQFLVIKEEPIEWTEMNSDEEMELIDEKDAAFDASLVIKPEVYMDDSSQEVATTTNELYSPLTCELCTETFTIPAEWVRHVQTHTDMLPAKRQRRDKPSKDDENATFPSLHCDMCQKFFPTPAEWVHHIQDSHTDFELHMFNKRQPAQPLVDVQTKDAKQCNKLTNVHKVCSECNKVFPSHASMLIHKRTHTGEKPFSCDLCHKGFNVKSNLLRHLRTLHNKIINATDIEHNRNDEDDEDSG